MYEGFGISFECRFPLPELPSRPASHPPDVVLELESLEGTRHRFTGPGEEPVSGEATLQDGCRYVVQRGRGDDLLIDYDNRASFLVAPNVGCVTCGPADVQSWPWRRFLLDTVLSIVSLARGFEALHAAAWQGPDGLVAVIAEQGGGKSTLLAEALRRGHTFFCDDVLALSNRDGDVLAFPGPPLMNLTPMSPTVTAAEDLGRVLARVDGESWISIDLPRTDPCAVRAVVFLTRTSDNEPTIESMSPSVATLLANSLTSGITKHRLARRFELFADLAQRTAMLRMTAPPDRSPGDLLSIIDESVTLL